MSIKEPPRVFAGVSPTRHEGTTHGHESRSRSGTDGARFPRQRGIDEESCHHARPAEIRLPQRAAARGRVVRKAGVGRVVRLQGRTRRKSVTLLVVAHGYREPEGVARIISARKATREEERFDP